ncbi:MAG: CvpA family protein [Bacteroidales bacterium]|nr:CvpA family protein [Bacteroidales bacterium]
MNTTTVIEVPIGSGVDGLIGILIIVGAVIGYKRGVIVECISFFSILILLTLCVNISKSVYGYLAPRSPVADLFAIMLMTACFILGLVFAISKINFRTQLMLQSTILGGSARYLGAFFGAFKFYFISAVFLVTLFKIEEHAKYLPEAAKFSKLSQGSVWLITSIFPNIQFEKSDHTPMAYPNDANNNN